MTKDDVYGGYYISKTASIFINFWGMLHDEVTFPDPEMFKPERWIGEGIKKENDVLSIVFGFGRR